MGNRIQPAVLAAAMVLAACRSDPGRQAPVGEAYVGPAVLNLRDQLTARAKVVATVQHGERLQILERKRRFCRVRTLSGSEGWTDGRQFLDQEQMLRLRRLGERAAALPAQGRAMPLDLLNVHTEPNRQAPSFYQLEEGELSEVIAQRAMARVPYPGKPSVNPAGTGTDGANSQPVPKDDWTLVRLKDGRAGWVLQRMLAMAIPEEVAQYAEGHFITSYFPLGEVKTEKGKKSHWLWTTRPSARQAYDFDSFRVFVYSQRRKRYETAYIERNLTGYYPVMVAQEDKTSHNYLFRLICQGKDGVLHRRTYEFAETRVRLLAKEPWQIEFVEDLGTRGRDDSAGMPDTVWERLR